MASYTFWHLSSFQMLCCRFICTTDDLSIHGGPETLKTDRAGSCFQGARPAVRLGQVRWRRGEQDLGPQNVGSDLLFCLAAWSSVS